MNRTFRQTGIKTMNRLILGRASSVEKEEERDPRVAPSNLVPNKVYEFQTPEHLSVELKQRGEHVLVSRDMETPDSDEYLGIIKLTLVNLPRDGYIRGFFRYLRDK